MNDVWNEICYELKSCIQHNVLEKEYENTIVNCMILLGWKKFRGEIITQYAVQIGHENKYADIVVLQDSITFVVCTEWGIFNIEPIIRFATDC